MLYEKHIKLIDSLLSRTKLGKIDWQSAPDEKGFQVSLRNNTIRVRVKESFEGESTYYIDLFNDEGLVAESFSDLEIDTAAGYPVNGLYFERMRELHELARRSAFGADKVLNDILSELEDD